MNASNAGSGGAGPAMRQVYWHGTLTLANGTKEPVVVRQIFANHVMLECGVGAKVRTPCTLSVQVPPKDPRAAKQAVSVEGEVLQSSFSDEHFKLIVDIKQLPDGAQALLEQALGHPIR